MNHNLDLFRLDGFTGMRRPLLQLHEWMTGGDDLPAIAISGEQGNGKSTLATAAAWNHVHHFSDGIIRVSPAGAAPFRLYDVVRTLDAVFDTALTRVSPDRWGVAILEQLYRRRRLVILDKLAGATENEIRTLVDVISHLHESGGNSRLLLIDRNFQPGIAELVRFQNIRLTGIAEADTRTFIQLRAPEPVRTIALDKAETLFALTGGRPLSLRLALGLLLDFSWDELFTLLQQIRSADGVADVFQMTTFAVENLAIAQPQIGPFLERLVTARGGASFDAVRELYWGDLGTQSELDLTLTMLSERSLIEFDRYRERVVLHPVIRRYLEQSVAMLGEAWDRRHARFYVGFAEKYLEQPLEAWPEIDIEWGNIFKSADWCQQRVQRIWQKRALDMVANAAADGTVLPLPLEIQQDTEEIKEDLRLVRNFGLALAHYAFWRHPPGILAWLASSAVAALALADYRDYAWFLMNMGRQLFFMGDVEDAINWFQRARAIFDPRDLLAELAYVCTDLGTSLRILDQPRQALAYFHAAFDCVVQLVDQEGLATAYMNLGSAYYSVNSFERALQEQRKALRVAMRRGSPRLIGSVYNNMGLSFEAMERLDDALRAYEYALREFKKSNDIIGISACYNNLGSACYARQDYAQAVAWYEQDLELSQSRGAWTDMAATLHNLGHVALEMNQTDSSVAYFKQSRDLYAAFELTEYVNEEQEMIDEIAMQTKR